MARVDIGFFPDFKSRDTLLIDGDREGLRLLAITLRNLTNTIGSTSIHELPFAKTHHDIRMVARLSERDEGASIHGVDVTWQCRYRSTRRRWWHRTRDSLACAWRLPLTDCQQGPGRCASS